MLATMTRECCPVCTDPDPAVLGAPLDVPVLMNRLHATRADARAAACGTLSLLGCERCGFVWNRAFRREIVAYDESYENDQSHSPVFAAHLRERARAVVAAAPDGPIDYLEIGCGQGGFMAEVARASGRRLRSAVGFDPAWRAGGPAPTPGLQMHKAIFDAAAARLLVRPPNLVASRHTIEHVPDPVAFLRSVREALGPGSAAKLFLETPCAAWIGTNVAMQDLFYEHCSLFTADALRRALDAAGFGTAAVSHVFGGQYLWAQARAGDQSVHTTWLGHAALGPLATARGDFVRRWRGRLAELIPSGAIAIWGAGAKGVAFALLADPDASVIDHAVDINPAKQGLFLPGTGLPVLTPEQSAARRPSSILVMNPNYLDEVRALVGPGRGDALLIPLS